MIREPVIKHACLALLTLCLPEAGEAGVKLVKGFNILEDASGALYSPVGEIHGSVLDRIDIVFLAEGYTEAELSSFQATVIEFQKELFGIEPFTSNECAFNMWMVGLVSNESGISDPRAGTNRDTALGCKFNDMGEPLMYIDGERIRCWNAVDAADIPACDYICVILNDPATPPHDGAWAYPAEMVTYMSSGYVWGTVIAHELGHLIAGLGDEYTCYLCNGSTIDSNRSFTTTAVNASAAVGKPNLTTDYTTLPTLWKSLVSVNVPTTPDDACSGNSIGAWEGGGTFKNGVYRPAEYCIMGGKMCSSEVFCWVCHELLKAAIPPPHCSDISKYLAEFERLTIFNDDVARLRLGPCWHCPPDPWLLHYDARVVLRGLDPNIFRVTIVDERGMEVAVGKPTGDDRVEITFEANRLRQYSVFIEMPSDPKGTLEMHTELYMNGVRQPLR